MKIRDKKRKRKINQIGKEEFEPKRKKRKLNKIKSKITEEQKVIIKSKDEIDKIFKEINAKVKDKLIRMHYYQFVMKKSKNQVKKCATETEMDKKRMKEEKLQKKNDKFTRSNLNNSGKFGILNKLRKKIKSKRIVKNSKEDSNLKSISKLGKLVKSCKNELHKQISKYHNELEASYKRSKKKKRKKKVNDNEKDKEGKNSNINFSYNSKQISNLLNSQQRMIDLGYKLTEQLKKTSLDIQKENIKTSDEREYMASIIDYFFIPKQQHSLSLSIYNKGIDMLCMNSSSSSLTL